MSNENVKNNQPHDSHSLVNTPENQRFEPIPMEVDFVNEFDNLNMNDTPSFRYIRRHTSADNSSSEDENPSLVSVESLPVLRKRKKECLLKGKTSKKRRTEYRKNSEAHKRRHRRRCVRRLLDFGSDGEQRRNNRPPTPYPDDNNPGRRHLRPVRPSMNLKAKTVSHFYTPRLSPISSLETCCSTNNLFIPMNKNVDNDQSDSSN